MADGLRASFDRIYRQHGLEGCFEARAISGDLGVCKPHARMFISAMEQMGLTDADKDRIVMVGNNLERDIAGANRLGLTSILMSWTTRYRLQPRVPEETPDFVVARPDELPALLAELDRQMKKRRDPGVRFRRCRTVTDKPFSPQPEPCCSAGKTGGFIFMK